MRNGFTLLELLVLLVLAGILADLGVRPARRQLDRWAVLSAREEVASLVAIARVRAVGTVGATLSVDEDSGAVEVHSAVWPDTIVRIRERHGVELEIVGSARTLALRFNALGLGEVASRRLRFMRGDASTDLVLSSHGRLRRQ
jgi:prepilin-type N-terminal cleavage/methylation domain-containing protein